MRGKMREIADMDDAFAKVRLDLGDLLMRLLEEFVEQTKLVHEFERGRMDGVAAEIAEEVLVFFEHENFDAGASEQKSQHHTRRAAAHDATAGMNGFSAGRLFFHGRRHCLRHATT